MPTSGTSSNTLTLPQLPSKPLLQGEHHNPHISSGLSSGLPSLSHSMKVPTHISTFPSLLVSENPSRKVSCLIHYMLINIVIIINYCTLLLL